MNLFGSPFQEAPVLPTKIKTQKGAPSVNYSADAAPFLYESQNYSSSRNPRVFRHGIHA